MSNCTKCGAELVPGNKFCTSCGAPVEAAPVQPQQPVYAQPVQPQAGYAQPVQPQAAYAQPNAAAAKMNGFTARLKTDKNFRNIMIGICAAVVLVIVIIIVAVAASGKPYMKPIKQYVKAINNNDVSLMEEALPEYLQADPNFLTEINERMTGRWVYWDNMEFTMTAATELYQTQLYSEFEYGDYGYDNYSNIYSADQPTKGYMVTGTLSYNDEGIPQMEYVTFYVLKIGSDWCIVSID